LGLKNIHNVYFIGIGGIGMSSIANYFKSLKKNVAGFDKTPTEITSALINLGIQIHFEDAVELIPSQFKNQEDTIVIYTPAVPKNHSELNYFLNNNFTVL
jgi:UDP-N-acetylmuramate--alanine ligase